MNKSLGFFVLTFAALSTLSGCSGIVARTSGVPDSNIHLAPTPGRTLESHSNFTGEIRDSNSISGAYVAEVSQTPITRFFRIVREVECDEYVFLTLYSPSDYKRDPSLLKGINRDGLPVYKCAQSFHRKYARGDERLAGADGVIYDGLTYELTGRRDNVAMGEKGDVPELSLGRGKYEYADLGDPDNPPSKRDPAFFSGSTGAVVQSSGAYLRGWAIKFVNDPSPEEITKILSTREHFLTYDTHNAPVRINLLQFQTVLYWIEKNHATQYIPQLLAYLPKWDVTQIGEKMSQRNQGSIAEISRGYTPAYQMIVRTLAVLGDRSVMPIMIEILRYGSHASGRPANGESIFLAANVLACSGSLEELDEIARIGVSLPDTSLYRAIIANALFTAGRKNQVKAIADTTSDYRGMRNSIANVSYKLDCPFKVTRYDPI